MDDSCAVCADTLEWVAYGPCGHREVCSTCVARLRFVLDDRRCCLCKSESSIVFVTKALGDYTRMINDFSVFPSDPTEGRVGPYWYHEDTQSFFDDVDHYKMVKAMCKLSCSICEKNGEEQASDSIKRRSKFKNIEQLKGHLYHRHRMFMCSLCLEGRKVFICEQKLYTRAQLNQHISTGDSEVDGSESERGGFMGHPMCEFCRNPFYGDNELYLHMSTEHYTCHICQRQHPGQYDYYKNYDDLEIHFRHEHFLCENEACLAKKFVVFQTESEMKRHNAIEHGGHMSRSKRNAALQIPTSFRYRRSTEQDGRRGRGRGRGRGLHFETTDDQLSLAIQASLETAADNPIRESLSNARSADNAVLEQDDPAIGMDLLNIAPDSEPTSRYLQAVGQSSQSNRLDESFFPPLSGASGSSRPVNDSEGPDENSMAARLRQRYSGSVKVLNSGRNKSWANQGSTSKRGSTSSYTAFPALVSSVNTSHSTLPVNQFVAVMSSSLSSSQGRPTSDHGRGAPSSSSSSQARPASDHGRGVPSSSGSSSKSSTVGRFTHSASAPDLVDRDSLKSSTSSNVPASSENQMQSESLLNGNDVQTANKTLVERIRSSLGHDEDKYAAFKAISSEYRRGLIDAEEYLAYVEQFGLLHLVLELASLCPDAEKQRELIKMYNVGMLKNNLQENSASTGPCSKNSGKGKGKQVNSADSSTTKESLADSVIGTVRKMQASYKPSEEVVVLSKDGYRAGRGKLKGPLVTELPRLEQSSGTSHLPDLSSNGDGGGASNKQKRKTSKFHRVRLGDGLAAALLDLGCSDAGPEHLKESVNDTSSDCLPVRGVWRNGGGQKLVAKTQRNVTK